tara:strand:- start:29 stop:508 length:480 start_codon:yes stop_codon:yes gene_type:complete
MIVSCTNCNKNFEINSSLIPDSGRLVQCGKCNNQWFFKKEAKILKQDDLLKNVISPDVKKIDSNIISEPSLRKSSAEIKDEKNELIRADTTIEPKRKDKIKSLRFLKFMIVFLITIIAFIIIADTFQSPISFFVPNIEIILFNLYETFKDIFLFFKDLI